MSKDLTISLLLDFYGEILSEKQREVVELYYNEDLSLAEIAQIAQITRQGVRDSIKRAEHVLLDLEERLGLAKKFYQMESELQQIVTHAAEIQQAIAAQKAETVQTELTAVSAYREEIPWNVVQKNAQEIERLAHRLMDA